MGKEKKFFVRLKKKSENILLVGRGYPAGRSSFITRVGLGKG